MMMMIMSAAKRRYNSGSRQITKVKHRRVGFSTWNGWPPQLEHPVLQATLGSFNTMAKPRPQVGTVCYSLTTSLLHSSPLSLHALLIYAFQLAPVSSNLPGPPSLPPRSYARFVCAPANLQKPQTSDPWRACKALTRPVLVLLCLSSSPRLLLARRHVVLIDKVSLKVLMCLRAVETRKDMHGPAVQRMQKERRHRMVSLAKQDKPYWARPFFTGGAVSPPPPPPPKAGVQPGQSPEAFENFTLSHYKIDWPGFWLTLA